MATEFFSPPPQGSAGAGVSSLNTLTGALTIAAGTNITVTPSGGNTLTIASSGGGSGVTTMAAVGSTPSANGASISGNTLTLQPADSTHPGLVTILTQVFTGKKTIQTSAANLFVVDTANPVGLNNGVSGALSVFNDVNGGMAVNLTNTNAGVAAQNFLGLGNDIANGRLGLGVTSSTFTGNPDSAMWISDSLNSIFQNDTPAAPFIWNGSTGRIELMRLAGAVAGRIGDLSLTGGHATERLVLNPQQLIWANQTRTVNGAIQFQSQNLSAGGNAYNQFNILNDTGSGLFFGTSSSTATFGQVAVDQSFILAEGVNGLSLWAQAGTGFINFATGATQRMRIKANGNINMTLQTFISDGAAGTGGLVTGDLYILTATQSVTSKL